MTQKKLKHGYTTGACATAALRACLLAIINKKFEKTSTIILPKGQAVKFKIEKSQLNNNFASATIKKNAGDDPDVTHAAMITTKVQVQNGSGVFFYAGRGVGIVTKPGLPIAIGQPAISPVPKQMMENVVADILPPKKSAHITIEIENGEQLALQTWNAKVGVIGGLSILGTTGIVKPFSCSAWIHSLHQGIDVARAEAADHVIAATGSTSENVAQTIYKLPPSRFLDMGDFVGAVLKYVKKYPIKKLTIAGGFAKITKLAQGEIDLHSSRSQVNIPELISMLNVTEKINATTAAQVLEVAQKLKIDLPKKVGEKALQQVKIKLGNAPVQPEIIIVDRQGSLLCQIN